MHPQLGSLCGWFASRALFLQVFVVATTMVTTARCYGAADDSAGFIATFSNGAEVELIGLADHPSNGQGWWAPDGTQLAKPPYAQMRANLTGSQDSIVREICFRWRKQPADDWERHGPTVDPSPQGVGMGPPLDSEGKHIRPLNAAVFEIPDKATCTLRFAVSAPPEEWKTVFTVTSGGEVASVSKRFGDQNVGAVFGKCFAIGPDTIMTVSYNLQADVVRLVAGDRNKRPHIGKSDVAGSARGFMQHTFLFSGVLPEQLRRFELQTGERTHEWVEFRNVSLHPGKVTDVETSELIIQRPESKQQDPPAAKTETAKPILPAPQTPKPFTSIRKKSDQLLEELAMLHGYSLEHGQHVRRVATPFPPERMEYYRAGHAHQAEAIPRGPTVMCFRWEKDRLHSKSSTFAGPVEQGLRLKGVIKLLAGMRSHEIKADKSLLDIKVTGDWIVRTEANRDLVLAQLQKILRDECQLPMTLAIREEMREVFVVSGDYRHRPLDEKTGEEIDPVTERSRKEDIVHIFGKDFFPDSGAGGGSGSFDEFLQWLGEWIDVPIVNEVNNGPIRDIGWRLHRKSPFTEQDKKNATEAEFVLPNITKQTGLVFTKVIQPVKVLFVERHIDREAERAAAKKRAERLKEVMRQLTEEHGYALAKGERLKYVDTEPDARQTLFQFTQASIGVYGAPQPAPTNPPRYETFVFLFRADGDKSVRWTKCHYEVPTLEEVFEMVLDIPPQQIESKVNVLDTHLLGDWIVAWDSGKNYAATEADVAAFAKVLNDQLGLGLRLTWEEAEREVIVVSGEYKFSPLDKGRKNKKLITIPARRSNVSGQVGSYQEFLQAIGRVLMTPLVDETTKKPSPPDLFWKHEEKPVTHRLRLDQADERRIFNALSLQTGLTFTRAKRPVKILRIDEADQ